jgi:Origin recognition complex (ORC) subunit 3 N-terminus
MILKSSRNGAIRNMMQQVRAPIFLINKDFRIVIAFQDTEAFPAHIISDFILRNQVRLSRLPVVLLFGVASTLDQFQQMLPTSVIKSLNTKIFEVRKNDDCLKIIIDRVIVYISNLT